MLKYIFSLAILPILGGCALFMDPPTGELRILNYTDSAIYVYSTCSDSLPYEYGLKLFVNYGGGTDECGNKMRDTSSPNYRINAYSYGTISGFGSPEKRQTQCTDNKLRLYFIKEITMRAKTWEEIYKNQLYEKKMILTQEQLNNLCWKVTYEATKK